jgi:long-subunit fatty acid transport protein
MKNKIIILLLFFPFVLNAQGLQFGIYGDPAICWLKPDSKSINQNSARFGIGYGLSIDNYFAENYAFSTGIGINHLGGNLSYDDPVTFKLSDSTYQMPANSEFSYKLQYIKIPIGLKLKTNEIGYSSFFAHLGINAQFRIKSTGETSSSAIKNENFNKETFFFEMGYYFGAGIMYSLGGNTSLTAGLTYNNGFLDIFHKQDEKVISNHVALRLGVLF